jgi:transcriptional regulator with XRE-family HTH domain
MTTSNATALKEFVLQKSKERKLSLRDVARNIGISISYLSEMLNGKKAIDVDLCNRIADFFGTQRVTIYNMVGWINLNEDEEFLVRFQEYAKNNPEFANLVQVIMNTDDKKERDRISRLLRAGLEK